MSFSPLASEIKDRVFYNCRNLWRIDLPSSLTSIGESAFYNSGLKHVYYGDTEAKWATVEVNETGNTKIIDAIMHYALLKGNPTGSGKVDIQDVAFVYEFLTGQKQGENAVEENSAQWNAMNVNGDETVDVYDLQMIYEMACGLR